MEIEDVKLYPVATQRRNDTTSYHVTILLHTNTGITGLGEISDLSHVPGYMPDVTDLEAHVNRLLEGIDPANQNRIEETLSRVYPHGSPKAQRIKTGLEVACHDAAARELEISLSTYLGGQLRDRIPICYPIFPTEAVDDVPHQLEAVEMAYENGFDVIRYYFGRNLDADERFLTEFEQEFSDRMTIKSLDASGRFGWKEFLAAYDRLERFVFTHVESPVPRGIREETQDMDGLERVTKRIDRPVSEHVTSIDHALELLDRDAADIFNVSLHQSGGLRNAQRIFDLAANASVDCLVGTTQEMSIGTAAQAHVAAAARGHIRRSDPVGAFLYTEDVVAERVQYEDGYLLVPDGPGLGVEIDPDELEEHTTPLSIVDSDLHV